MGRPRRWVLILFLLLAKGQGEVGPAPKPSPCPGQDSRDGAGERKRMHCRHPSCLQETSRPPAQSGASRFPPAPRRRAPPRLVVPFPDLGTSALLALACKSCQVGGRFGGTPLEASALGLERSCNIFIGERLQERNDSPTDVPFSAATGLLLVPPETGMWPDWGRREGMHPPWPIPF